MIIHLHRPLNTISPRDKTSAVDQNWDTDFWIRPCHILVIVVVRYIDINFLKKTWSVQYCLKWYPPFLLSRYWHNILLRACNGLSQVHSPCQVRSDRQTDLDNRCVWGLYEMEGVRASWIFIMTSLVYWLWYGGHTQGRLSGLQELGREEGSSQLIAHIHARMQLRWCLCL